MVKSGQDLVNELTQSGMTRFWVSMIPPVDREYYIPRHEDMLNQVEVIRLMMLEDGLVFRDEVGDCDDFSLYMMKECRVQAWEDEGRRRPWPFGMAFVTAPFGHAFNIVRTRTGWFEIEPQPGGKVSSLQDTKSAGYYLILI